MNRRSALQLGLITALGSSLPRAIQAQSSVPPAPVQTLFYRFAVGDFEAISLYDGTASMPNFHPMWAPEAKKEEVVAALEKSFLPTDKLVLAFNALIVRTGKDTVLIDSGNGVSARPKLGQVEANLRAAGVKPEDITAIVLSHAHGDHMGGLVTADGKSVFPNAALYLSETERDFWLSKAPDLSKSALPEEGKKGMIAGAQKTLEILKGQTKVLKAGSVIVPGFALEAAAGHTPGHSTVRVTSGSQELLYLADTAHHPALMFENPDWTVAFDANPRQSAETRKLTFASMAAKKSRIHLFHMPFPGVGHIRKGAGASYEWVPEPWNLSQA